jgi:hypothetical protein
VAILRIDIRFSLIFFIGADLLSQPNRRGARNPLVQEFVSAPPAPIAFRAAPVGLSAPPLPNSGTPEVAPLAKAAGEDDARRISSESDPGGQMTDDKYSALLMRS